METRGAFAGGEAGRRAGAGGAVPAAIIPASVAMPMSSRARARRPRTSRRKTLVAMLRGAAGISRRGCGQVRGLASAHRPQTAYTARRAASGSRSLPENFDPARPRPPPGERLERAAERRARVRQALDALDAESREMIALPLRIGTFLPADCGDAGNNPPRASKWRPARCAGKAANPVGRRGAVRQAGREGNGEETGLRTAQGGGEGTRQAPGAREGGWELAQGR